MFPTGEWLPMTDHVTDSPHDLGSNIHNRCGVRIGLGSTHGVCPVHSLPVYREPSGIDWFTDEAGVRELRMGSSSERASPPEPAVGVGQDWTGRCSSPWAS